MAMGTPYGLQAMLKEGHKHFSGVDEAVIKNIDACKGLAQITRTSLGPNGTSECMRSTDVSCGQVSLDGYRAQA
jgi:T-complex protein 1 subunit theta